MGKKIAFIGSSGGNLYKQGGNNLPAMMKEICGQTKAADMEITFVQYVLASGSLDNVGPDSPATLYTWNGRKWDSISTVSTPDLLQAKHKLIRYSIS